MFLIAFFQHILYIGLIRPYNRYSGSFDKPCIVSLHCGCPWHSIPQSPFRNWVSSVIFSSLVDV